MRCLRLSKYTVNFFHKSCKAIVFGCKSVREVISLFPKCKPDRIVLTTSTFRASLNAPPNFFRIAYSGSPWVEWESEVFNGIVIRTPLRSAKCLLCGKAGKLVFLGVRDFSELCKVCDHVTDILRL